MLSALAIAIRFTHTAIVTNGCFDYRQALFTFLAQCFVIANKLAAISAPLRKENADGKGFKLVLVHSHSPKAYI